jgi:hypothetical protein
VAYSPPSCGQQEGQLRPHSQSRRHGAARHPYKDITIYKSIWYNFGQYKRVLHGAAGMTQEHRLALIIKTIQELKAGIPVSRGRMTLLLEPWPDLYRNARARRGVGWINLLQAAAARAEHAL